MVSIVIPAYNEEAFLPRLLESIKAQDYTDYEVIVADNDSKDGTRKVAQKYGARVVHGGLPAAGRNRGAEAARGEYILFLDADTLIPEGFISGMMSRFDKDFIDIAIPWIKPIDSAKPVFTTIFQFSNTFFKLMEAIQPQGLGVCILTTRRLHRRIGGFSEKHRVSEDFDYINRASQIGRFRVFTNMFVYHSVRRYKAEGVATLMRKQFKGGLLNLVGRPADIPDYEFGAFSRYLLEERNGKRADASSASVKKLLTRFSTQSVRLQDQIEKLEKSKSPTGSNGKNGSSKGPSRGGAGAKKAR